MTSAFDIPAPRVLAQAERLDWLRLYRSENVGPVTFGLLLRRFGSAQAALEALPDLAKRGGRKGAIKIMGRAQAEREWELTEAQNARFIARIEPDYPALLRYVEDAPPILVAKGHAQIGQKPTLGMVGARNASAVGLRFARRLAQEAGAQGLAVASGLARGIDAAAHEGSLASGTIAVLGTGIDTIYPEENSALFARIGEAGLILTDYPVETVAKPQHFVRRNRIIAGLSYGVAVIEAALRSGSLHTARFAADLGREVFAVPGSPLDPRAQGCNHLIKDGAVLIQDFNDILMVLQPLLDKPLAMPDLPLFRPSEGGSMDEGEISEYRHKILEKLSFSPASIDDIVRLSGAPISIVLMVLLEYELAGRIQRQPGAMVALSGASE